MSKQAAEHHSKAAEDHEHAARHHRVAATHHESGNYERAVHDAHSAQGHLHHATHHATEAAKSHLEHHGSKSKAVGQLDCAHGRGTDRIGRKIRTRPRIAVCPLKPDWLLTLYRKLRITEVALV
jgi:hypothetical protein